MTHAVPDWNFFSMWQCVLPPNRPTEESLKAIGEILESTEPGPVAVLGSTIEFRDLLARSNQFRPIVLEKWPAFTEQVDHLRLYSNSEELVIGDWLDTLPSFRGTFKIVLSDFTRGNIPYELRDLFYSHIYNSLCPGGLFIDRVLQPGPHFKPLSALDRYYSARPSNLRTLNDFSSDYLFLSELVGDAGVVDTGSFYQYLRARDADPGLLRLAELCEMVTPSGQTWYYGKPEREFATPEDVGFVTKKVLADAPQYNYADHVRQYIYQR